MIKDRLFRPAKDQIIYHYCRAEAFLEIIRSQNIWHSAHALLNDSLERTWGYVIFLEVVEALREEFDAKFTDRILEIVEASQVTSVAMISSYSLDGDVLSQWRAYSNDGHGFAIGLSSNEMDMPAKPLRVLYNEAAQREELTNNLRHIFKYEKSIGFQFDAQFHAHLYALGLDLCAYKNPAFAEEMEIRRVHISSLAMEEALKAFVPLGAIDQKGVRRSEPVSINYRVANGLVLPYVSLDVTDGGKNSPIKEVILGPKNANLESSIGTFLSTCGLKNIAIKRSRASYR